MLHRTAKLTPFGRRLLVDRILVEGWAPAIAAETVGVSRATAYKWLRRYRAEGLARLEDRSARPVRRPRALADRDVPAFCACAVGCGSAPTASDRCWVTRARRCTASCAGTASAAWRMPIA